jgi:hypothetical protein
MFICVMTRWTEYGLWNDLVMPEAPVSQNGNIAREVASAPTLSVLLRGGSVDPNVAAA